LLHKARVRSPGRQLGPAASSTFHPHPLYSRPGPMGRLVLVLVLLVPNSGGLVPPKVPPEAGEISNDISWLAGDGPVSGCRAAAAHSAQTGPRRVPVIAAVSDPGDGRVSQPVSRSCVSQPVSRSCVSQPVSRSCVSRYLPQSPRRSGNYREEPLSRRCPTPGSQWPVSGTLGALGTLGL
jgi:hypothetical protein